MRADRYDYRRTIYGYMDIACSPGEYFLGCAPFHLTAIVLQHSRLDESDGNLSPFLRREEGVEHPSLFSRKLFSLVSGAALPVDS